MKKRLFALTTALILACTFIIPAGAATSDDYWEGYDEGYDQGYDDGLEAWEAGELLPEPEPEPEPTREDGYADGYEEGFQAGYEEAQWGAILEEGRKDWIEMNLEAAGGTLGKINVQYNESCIAFGKVWPEKCNGRVMAPVRPVLETMGAEVAYDGGVVTATMDDGRVLTYTVGTDTVAVTDGAGETKTFAMDCASYIRGGSTFVPVRFFGEALGMYVLWDGDFNAVVLVDVDALAATYDPQLTAVNLLLSEAQLRQAPDKTYRETANLKLDVTAFDTIAGDKKFSASAKTDTLSGSEGFQTTLQVDASALVDLLRQQYEQELGPLPSEDMEMFEMLGQLEVEMRYNRETDTLYIRSPYIDLMMGQTTWLEQYLDGASLGLLPAADGWVMTATDMMLVSQIQNVESGYGYAFGLYSDAIDALNQLVTILGDDQFTRSGSTWTVKTDDLMASFYEDAGYYMEFVETVPTSATLQITDKGNGRCDITGSFAQRSADYVMELDFSSRDTSTKATMDFHVRNTLKGALTVDSTRRVTDETVETLPPVADVTMDLEDMGYM